MNSRIAVLAALAIVSIPVTAGAQKIQSLSVEGRAPASSEHARTIALDKAFGAAVRQVAASRVPSPLSADGRRRLNTEVYRRARRFIASFRVASQVQEGEQLVLSVSARVDVGKLTSAIEALQLASPKPQGGGSSVRSSRPKVVVVGAIMPGGTTLGADVGSSLARAVQDAGLKVAASPAAPVTNVEGAMNAAAKAKVGGAVLVIVNRGAQKPVRGTSLAGAEVTVSVRVLDRRGSATISEVESEAAGFGPSSAAARRHATKEALVRALSEARKDIDKRWSLPLDREGIQVTIVGVQSYRTLQALERHASASRSKLAITGRRLGHGVIQWTVASRLDAKQLAALLKSAPIPSGSISARAGSAGKIEVRVRDFGGGA